jgi:hypothetical protein
MDSRAAILALVALASAVLAALGAALTAWLDVFAPCRVDYRAPQAVYDSLVCQLHAAITLFSLLLVGATGVFGIVVAARLYMLHRRSQRQR